MASNLKCVGLAVGSRDEFAALVESTLADARLIGSSNGFTVHAWQDPSGTRLVITTEGRKIVDMLPSFAAATGARLAGVHAANDEVAIASVVDEKGETLTMLAAEVEQRRFLSADTAAGQASIVALGLNVSVHSDEHAFAASDASLLSPGKEPGDPPAHVVERGMPWPPRMAAESFISYGVFGPPEQAQAFAPPLRHGACRRTAHRRRDRANIHHRPGTHGRIRGRRLRARNVYRSGAGQCHRRRGVPGRFHARTDPGPGKLAVVVAALAAPVKLAVTEHRARRDGRGIRVLRPSAPIGGITLRDVGD